ncbi:MAG: sigma-70 family RNA polymerase sigma factor [Balneolales bacterium]
MLEDILNGCLKRQRESQKELYEMFYAYGMSITLRYAESREQAASTFNDAFMKVLDNIKKFDTSRPFKPWLRQIVVNSAIDQYHKDKRNMELMDFNLNGNDMGTDETIISGISYQEITKMVQQLTPAYRTVFNLFVIDGFKHEEIAEMLKISVGTSKSNLAKAKRNLRVRLEKNLST